MQRAVRGERFEDSPLFVVIADFVANVSAFRQFEDSGDAGDRRVQQQAGPSGVEDRSVPPGALFFVPRTGPCR